MLRLTTILNAVGSALRVRFSAFLSIGVLLALLLALLSLLPTHSVLAEETLFLPNLQGKASSAPPEGDSIAYSIRGGLFVVDAAGGSTSRLLTYYDDANGFFVPRWSDDNRMLHYWYQSETYGYVLGQIPFDSNAPTALISLTLESGYGFVDWTADGTKVLLEHSDNSGPTFESHFYVMGANGTGLRQVPAGSEGKYYASWSPDGTKIIYSQYVSATMQIFYIEADGGTPVQVKTTLSQGCCAVWSPSGNQLVFEYANSEGFADIYTVNLDGNNLRNLTEENPDANDMMPVWSPDGTKIAFVTYRDDDWYLYIMNADGSNPRPVYTEPGFYQRLTWSPDSKKIAFLKDFVVGSSASADPNIVVPVTERDLGVIEIATGTEARLTFGGQDPYFFAWSN